MAVNGKKVEYSKRFISKTDSEDISHHGSPEWRYFQTINDEDIKLRKLIIDKFALKSKISTYGWSGEAEGFDGKQQYKFGFNADFPEKPETEGEKNVNYSSIVGIIKAGALEELAKECDLEKFLLNEGFKRKK
jgi:hypothetical protein